MSSASAVPPRSSIVLPASCASLRDGAAPLIHVFIDSAGEEWPPRDPEAYTYPEADPNYRFQLPPSPWTFDNGDLNPELRPSTTRRRRTPTGAPPPAPRAPVPPYHPDYDGDSGTAAYPALESDDDYDDDEYAENAAGRPREFVRRGSEGYEARPIDRETMLRRYVEDRTAEPGRYQLYVPSPPSEPDSGPEAEESIPLSEKLEMWRTDV